MSKKTWTTILIILLVVAVAVGIYFATKKDAPVDEDPTTIVETSEDAVTDVVDEVTETVEETTETTNP